MRSARSPMSPWRAAAWIAVGILAGCGYPPRALERGGNVPASGERVGTEQVAGEWRAWIEVVGQEPRLLRQRRGAPPEVVADRGGPDRLALSPDGDVAYWASSDGLPVLFVASPCANGCVPRAVANAGLVPGKGAPPAGFVAPPVHEGEMRFDGAALRWTGPDGVERRLQWRQP